MSDPNTKSMSELREHLIDKATTDEDFRARLIADPNAAIKDELNLTVPAGFNIKVHEDVADTSHLVLPPLARLEKVEIEQAAGGTPKYFWEVPWPDSN